MPFPVSKSTHFTLALISSLGFFALVESGLWIAGVQPLSLTEDPFVGFSSSQPLYIEDPNPQAPGMLITNPTKLSIFNPQTFPRKKPAHSYRIFTLGGSTTYGHPWNDAVSYSGWLRQFLTAAAPHQHWEVINAGGISYASYREARLVEELSVYQPDLFIIYSGHNEFLEERTYRKTASLPPFIRATSAFLDHTRTYSALRRWIRKLKWKWSPKKKETPSILEPSQMAGEVDDILSNTIGPTSYVRNDTLRQRILEHYQNSLTRIAELARASGAQVLFLTTPTNEKDCSPFKSSPSPGLTPTLTQQIRSFLEKARVWELTGNGNLANPYFDSAAQLDGRNADILYHAGKAAFAAGHYPEAKRYFQKASDEDICPLRALTAMRRLVSQVAEKTGMPWLDITAFFENGAFSRAGHNILGEPEFVDHVHLSIDGYRLIALALIEKMITLKIIHPDPSWGEAMQNLVAQKVWAGVQDSMVGMGYHNIAKVLNWAGKHEDAARIANKGLQKDSLGLEAFWSSLIAGTAAERQGKDTLAIVHYQRALRIDSNNAMAHHHLAEVLSRDKVWPEALAEFEKILYLNPTDFEAEENMGKIHLRLGHIEPAITHLKLAWYLKPQQPGLSTALGIALFQGGYASEAELHFQASLKLNPRDAWALMGLGSIAEKAGDKNQAVHFFGLVMQIAPEIHEAQVAYKRNAESK